MENNFKVGDRVRCIRNLYGYSLDGRLGTVCEVIDGFRGIGVDFDEKPACLFADEKPTYLLTDGILWGYTEAFIYANCKKASEREYITEI